jgi:hypothetical protein
MSSENNKVEISNRILMSHYEPWEIEKMKKTSQQLNSYSEVVTFLRNFIGKYQETKAQENFIKKSITNIEALARIHLLSDKSRATYLTELNAALNSSTEEDLVKKLKEGVGICGYGMLSNNLKCALEVAHYVLTVKNKQVEKEGDNTMKMMSLNHSDSE